MVDLAERKILEMIEQGVLSAEEGLRLMDTMCSSKNDAPEDNSMSSEVPHVSGKTVLEPARARFSNEDLRWIKRIKRWWILPFSIGTLITTLGALWLSAGYRRSGFGWGFWLAWIPLVFGILLLAVSFQTSRSVWLHVRIKQNSLNFPSRIMFSFPLPLKLTKWIFATFGNRIPGLDDFSLVEISDLLEKLSSGEPFYVQVNEQDGGQRVEVYIG